MSELHTERSEHVEKQSGIFQITLNLAITCLVSGIIIAAVYFFTHPIAVVKAEMLEELAMQQLVSDADTFSVVGENGNIFEASAKGNVIAYIAAVESKGYASSIKMLVSVSPEGTVLDFTITKMNETPGLGTKAAEEPFKGQFPGKTSDQLEVTKDASKTENIQAMTGATITSRAVTNGVKEAVDLVLEYTGG